MCGLIKKNDYCWLTKGGTVLVCDVSSFGLDLIGIEGDDNTISQNARSELIVRLDVCSDSPPSITHRYMIDRYVWAGTAPFCAGECGGQGQNV
jgi:hypothetical protein